MWTGAPSSLLATISAAPVAPVAPVESVAVFQTASFCAQASHLRALGPPRIAPESSGRTLSLWVGFGRPWATSGVFLAWAGYFGCGKTLGGLAAVKSWAGYLGCGNTLGGVFRLRKHRAGAIVAAEKPRARAHSGSLTHRLCIFDI